MTGMSPSRRAAYIARAARLAREAEMLLDQVHRDNMDPARAGNRPADTRTIIGAADNLARAAADLEALAR